MSTSRKAAGRTAKSIGRYPWRGLYLWDGCADLELTHKRLCGVTGLTVDPDQNKLVLDFCRKLEDETLADWYDQMFYFVRSEMEHYTMMQKMSRDIEEDEDWGPTIFDESEEGELIDDV